MPQHFIKNKIRNVPDEVCKTCPQNYEKECRAFESPHSNEEYKHRMKGGGIKGRGVMTCDSKVK